MSRLAERWTIEIISELGGGPKRFNDLKRSISVNPNILTRSLRSLERDGLVARLPWPSRLLRVEYELTPTGERYLSYIDKLEQWNLEDSSSLIDSPRALPPPAKSVRARPRSSAGSAILDWAPLVHAGVVVADVKKSVTAFAEFFRLSRTPRIEALQISDGGSWSLLVSTVRFQNFFIEFIQPVGGANPFDEFARRHGEGIHHLGFHVEGPDFHQRLGWLQLHGRCVAGGAAWPFADVDLQEQLGTTIEILSEQDRRVNGFFDRAGHRSAGRAVAPREHDEVVDGCHVTHVGVVVRDIARTVAAYADIFGIQPPEVRLGTPRFPKDANAAPGACAKLARIGNPNIAIQLIEPVGASPIRDFLQNRESAVHHISVKVKNHLASAVSASQAGGGRRVLGRESDPCAQVDLRSTCGLILELTGSPA